MRGAPRAEPTRPGARPTPRVQRLDFSAEGEDGFAAYHDLHVPGSTVSRTGGPFHASLVAYRLPAMPLFARRVAGVVHERDTARVRLGGFDHVTLQVLGHGTLATGRPGEERAMRPGDVVVFDTMQSQRTIVEEAEWVTVAIPGEALGPSRAAVRRLHGIVLPAAAAGLLADFVLSLGRHAGTLDDRLAGRSAAMVRDLLSRAFDADGRGENRDDVSTALDLHRSRAEAFIDVHLANPKLDAAAVAAGLGLSRTVLYRAFAPVHGIMRCILGRRLARLRLALMDLSETRGVTEIAFDLGFTDDSHCSRTFKAAFGLPPSRYRAEAHLALAARGDVVQGWDEIWGEVL